MSKMDTKILRNISYGLYVITTMDGRRPTGCVANSVMQITSSPATVALSMNHDNHTNKCIKESGKFAVSILAEDSNPSLIGTFGFQSGEDVDKFEQVSYEIKEEVPVLSHVNGYMVFQVIDSIETSSHTVFLGEMIDGNITGGGTPMTYTYYHNVVKGKSPKNAPTYQTEESELKEDDGRPIFKCSICGYVYDGQMPFEELPEDYLCPICKQPKKAFMKES